MKSNLTRKEYLEALDKGDFDTIIDSFEAPGQEELLEKEKVVAKSQCHTWKMLKFGLPIALEEYIGLTNS